MSFTNTGKRQLELASDLGLKVVRLGVSWRLMHENPHETPDWFWTDLEQTVSFAESLNLKVILILAETPCWASADPYKICRPDGNHTYNFNYPPENVDDYAEALQELVKYFGNRIFAWEIWNEPNIVHFWPTHGNRNYDGFWPDPVYTNEAFLIEVDAAKRYADLLKTAYSAVKSVNKNATVLGGSIAGADTFYLNALYAAGVKGSFDALALHPYSAVLAFNQLDTPTGCIKPPWCYKTGVEKVRKLMVDIYNDDKPVWFTEFGASSFYGHGGLGDEQLQADYLDQYMAIMKDWDFVPVALWFNLVDGGGADPGYGLYRSDLSIKPVGQRLQNIIRDRELTLTPFPAYPKGAIYQRQTDFVWHAASSAVSYSLWVNMYANPPVSNVDSPGIVQGGFTPAESHCQFDHLCRIQPGVNLDTGSGQWWVTAHFADGSSQVSQGALFTIEDILNKDSDNDLVIDTQDNCIFASNRDQRDSDHDGFGNRCDPDFTNDGKVDLSDYDYLRVKYNSNDQDADINGDGIVNINDEVILKSVLNGRPGPSCCAQESASGLW